ncbi:citrate synthase [Ramlibacter sp. AW1]|uniref:citrate synthase (unknown stereospecificity) n=1 Tax=Ramlibacter aurantiacus TaxID=2801330 RepID=A0A936ZS36_9BURK|nr:citrate synthase [Ramlibacter aurantiacus]MBL0420075.1 citrate synthase [Ramlibacter aurantiacus]
MRSPAHPAYLTSQEAARLLKVKQQTLYSYVSRGLLQRQQDAASGRSMYERVEVERLAGRRRAAASTAGTMPARGPTSHRLAAGSAVCQLTSAGPRYRGRALATLLEHPGRFENVAEMLWAGLLMDEPVQWPAEPLPAALPACLGALQAQQPHVPVLRMFSLVCIVMGQSARVELRDGTTTRLARRMLMAMACTLGVLGPRQSVLEQAAGEAAIGQVILQALGAELRPQALRLVNALLIACADHGLVASTTAVRIAASAGSGLGACLMAGLSVHAGHRLGGSVDRLEDLLCEGLVPRTSANRLMPAGRGSRLAEDESPYADGDPRARMLIELALQVDERAAVSQLLDRMRLHDVDAVDQPGLELGLLVAARALGLPRRSAGALWVLARCAGWVAHAIEQRLNVVPMPVRQRHRRE